jgi:WhiB family redox-sensing transcriptional regulator
MDRGRGGLPFSDQAGSHWRAQAACTDGTVDPELFFPKGTGPAAQAQEAEAKRVCFVCPVMLACRDWAQEIPKLEGVWGGRNQHDRELTRGRRRQTVNAWSSPVASIGAAGARDPAGRRALAREGADRQPDPRGLPA